MEYNRHIVDITVVFLSGQGMDYDNFWTVDKRSPPFKAKATIERHAAVLKAVWLSLLNKYYFVLWDDLKYSLLFKLVI